MIDLSRADKKKSIQELSNIFHIPKLSSFLHCSKDNQQQLWGSIRGYSQHGIPDSDVVQICPLENHFAMYEKWFGCV